jgi:hypothetical protein
VAAISAAASAGEIFTEMFTTGGPLCVVQLSMQPRGRTAGIVKATVLGPPGYVNID